MGDKEIMSLVGPYESASTFAMSPMAIAVTRTALQIIDDEKLCERALHIQTQWQAAVASWNYPFLEYVTSRGADLNVTFKKNYPDSSITPRRVAMLCLNYGLLVFPLSGRLRMSLALTITDDELRTGFDILRRALDEVPLYNDIPGSTHIADINH
jgi:ornithine--oxo-acid transaminase